MSVYSIRSADRELIDEPGIPASDWFTCLKELDTVNTLLGGHAITVEGVRRLLPKTQRRIIIAEIGCGGGDNLNAIYRRNNKLDAHYIGIDINKACTEYASENCRAIPSSHFICSDFRHVEFGETKPDIIFNSLFCHHFSDADLVETLRWMHSNSRLGFFINDLQRHPVAFHSISILTSIFSRSYLVKHDAPISVMRGFRKAEWQRLMSAAGIKQFEIQWRWAFRYLVLFAHEQHG
jgi:SAM-dependent methyltransferase